MTTILLTGGCGFIGGGMLRYLYDTYPDYNIINVDLMTYCADERNMTPEMRQDKRFHFYKVDIADEKAINEIFETHDIDTVMNFAAETHVDRSFEDPLTFIRTNVKGTQVLLMASHKYGVNKFIHVSTDEVYGDADYSSKVTEDSPLNPTNPYSGSKTSAEFMVTSFAKSFKLPCIISRCNNVYGPKQFHEKVIPKFSEMCKNEQRMTVHGNGANVRSFIHVDDVVSAFDTIRLKGEAGQTYNIAIDNEISIVTLAEIISNFFTQKGYNVPDVIYVEDRIYNDERYYISSKKLEKLGWSTTIPFETGILSTLEWFNDQTW